MDTPPRNDDKTGSALNAQRFQMLEDIAKELSGEVIFPTSFDAAIRLRKALQDPNQSLDSIAHVLMAEPLVSAKLLSLSNSVHYNPTGKEIRNLQTAIGRLGINTVRTTTMAIAMNQLLRAKSMVRFIEFTTKLWEHSLATASASYVIASRLTRFSPDEAMLAGLMHDLGAFYMLYRATQYEELLARPDTIRYLIMQWHESIGYTLLLALGLPEDLAEAAREHDPVRESSPTVPRNLIDVVYVSNIIAGGAAHWMGQNAEKNTALYEALDPSYLALREEIDTRTREMLKLFA